MNYIERTIEKGIKSKFGNGKVIVIYGARQTGKTTLSRKVLSSTANVIFLTGDDTDDASLFSEITLNKWDIVLGKSNTVLIDEAQCMENIGQAVKLLIDSRDVQVIMTGSSSFSLASKSEESLTGRKNVFTLFPLSFAELSSNTTIYEEIKQLERRMIYGSYPEIVVNQDDAKENLKSLADSYLFRDLLEYEGIRKPDVLRKLLKALALQIGSTVSINELASLIGYSRTLIESYLTLLEEAFIIFHLDSFSTNLRNEIKKSRKYYFYDTGIRNSIVKNYALLKDRNDVGALWENYLISERLKYNKNKNRDSEMFFWRTTDQMEIDYIERTNGKISAFEFNWNTKKKTRITNAFTNRYPECEVKTITPENFQDFVI